MLTGYRVRTDSLSVTFDPFVAAGDMAAERFQDYVAGFSEARARRSKAQNRRIASRKALAIGQSALSRRLLIDALRYYPALPLVDARAAALALIHGVSWPLSDRGALVAYRAMRRVMRWVHARRSPARVDFVPGPQREQP